MTTMEPQEFTLDRTDKLRTELQNRLDKYDEKLEKYDEKIEKKVPNEVFYWTAGLFVTAVIGCFVYLYTVNEHVYAVSERLTKIEAQSKFFNVPKA